MAELILKNALGFLVNRTAAKLKNTLHRAFKNHGYDVTPEQWSVLMYLFENEANTQTEIAERLFKDKTNLTRILDGLEKKQLIERLPHENDRRSYRIVCTEAGLKLRERLSLIAMEVSETATRGLSRDEQDTLKRWLNVVFENLD